VVFKVLPEYVAKFEGVTEDFYDEYNDTFVDGKFSMNQS
jgi:hypothetical protein